MPEPIRRLLPPEQFALLGDLEREVQELRASLSADHLPLTAEERREIAGAVLAFERLRDHLLAQR